MADDAAALLIDTLEVVTFGCRLNAYESDQALARARADGLEDAVIFNTCAVTGEAVRQARQAIRKARRERPGAKLVVTGCAAQIDPTAFAAMPEVDLVLGNGLKSAEGSYTPAAFTQRVRVNDIASLRETAPHLLTATTERAPMWRCRTAAITAAPSASFRSGGATAARFPPARWWRRCAASPARAITRWC